MNKTDKTAQTYGKKPISLPAPETLESGKWYAITLSPADVQRLDKKHIVLPLESIMVNYEVLYNCKLFNRIEGVRYILYPEISSCGRIHYHGYIIFRSPIDIYTFYRTISVIQYHDSNWTLEMKELFDPEVWKTYVLKSSHIMYPVTKHYKIPYEITNFSLSEYLKLGSTWLPTFDVSNIPCVFSGERRRRPPE